MGPKQQQQLEINMSPHQQQMWHMYRNMNMNMNMNMDMNVRNMNMVNSTNSTNSSTTNNMDNISMNNNIMNNNMNDNMNVNMISNDDGGSNTNTNNQQRMMIPNYPVLQQEQQEVQQTGFPSTAFQRPHFNQIGLGECFDDTPTPFFHNQISFDIIQPSSPEFSDTESAHNDHSSSSCSVTQSNNRHNNNNNNNNNRSFVSTDKITSDDVLCGRGAGANTHTGNIKFRSFVGDYQHAYLSAKPLDKANIAKGIVSKITEKSGRFLKRSTEKSLDGGKGSCWYDIGFKAAREKTCQALRERAPSTFDIPTKSTLSPGGLFHKPSPDVSAAARQVESSSGAEGVKDHDILLGRGGVTNSHCGNKHFRTLVRQHQREYLVAPKLKKAVVAQIIVDEVYGQGGRFLTEKKGKWVEVSKEKAREKTSQALREKAPELRKIYHAAQELVAKKVAEKRQAQHQQRQELQHQQQYAIQQFQQPTHSCVN